MPQNRLLTRRSIFLSLGTLVGLGGAIGAGAIYQHQTRSINKLTKDFAVSGTASLKAHAQAKGLIFGAAARQKDLLSNPRLASQYVQECGMLVPEWELKWSNGTALLRSAPDKFDFTLADWMVKFAQTRGLLLRGHTLVWHLGLPDWFEKTVTPRNAKQLLVQHIQTVAGRYVGKIHSWDVVNEAIEPSDGRSDGLRNTPWLKFLGSDYIDLAFRVTAEADPNAMLVYNDYGLEYDTPADEAKRTAVLKLLERLKAKGTPIHALGVQAHLDGSETRLNANKLRRFFADVASLGLKILITELDVSDQKLPADHSVRDRIVASVYEDYLSIVLDEPAVIAVITWGLSDRYSWLSEFTPRADKLPMRPLPLSSNLDRKLGWNAIARAFDQAPKR